MPRGKFFLGGKLAGSRQQTAGSGMFSKPGALFRIPDWHYIYKVLR